MNIENINVSVYPNSTKIYVNGETVSNKSGDERDTPISHGHY